ncbi:hypothetical protein B0H11DRAFT_2241180 [Mycena galericulata]|nr:hypothetical protein B0H11DRAFT_2241180 [Mycena galericulata]
MCIQPAISSSRLCLPPELVAVVFGFLFFDLSIRDVASVRRDACSQTGAWMRHITSLPIYWSKIYIAFCVPTDAVALYLRLSASHLLDVEVVFQKSDSRRRSSDPRSLAARVRRRLEALLRVSHRIRSLTFNTDCVQALRAAQSVFSTLHAPRLTKLSLRYQYRFGGDHVPVAGYVWFDTFPASHVLPSMDLSQLSDLELRTISIPITSIPTSTLTRLHLYNLMDESMLSFDTVRVLLQQCTLLYDFALVNVACAGIYETDFDPGPFLVSASVRRFRVRFLHHPSLGVLYPRLLFPRLLHLTVELDCMSDFVDILSGCPDTYANVVHLCVVSHYPDSGSVGELCGRFPSLTQLDISQSPRGLSSILRHSSAHNGSDPFLVGLSSVLLGYESVADVKQFAVLHGAQDGSDGAELTLREVTLGSPFFDAHGLTSHVFDSVDFLVIAWLNAHVFNFSIPTPSPIRRPRDLVL